MGKFKEMEESEYQMEGTFSENRPEMPAFLGLIDLFRSFGRRDEFEPSNSKNEQVAFFDEL